MTEVDMEHQEVIEATYRSAGPGDAELVVAMGPDGYTVSVWHPADGRRVPVRGLPRDVQRPILDASGDAILALADDNGSEVGHAMSFPVDESPPSDLTPDFSPYALRGIATDRIGRYVVLSVADDDGYALVRVEPGRSGSATELYRTPNESWNGLISADGTLASLDTTDANPGVRRYALAVFDVADGQRIATLSDGPDWPIVGVRFSPVVGDPRILATTERGGFARPVVWDPREETRLDLSFDSLAGDVIALDWSDDGERVLVVHVDQGVHRVLEYHLGSARVDRLECPDGAYFCPDVASPRPIIWASHYGPENEIRLLRQRFDTPLRVLRLDRATGDVQSWPAGGADRGPSPSRSVTLTSADGTPVQLWMARPPDVDGPVPFVLHVHGGPNLVTVDQYNPGGLAWLADGFGYADLNYRGSVTFGRDFREGFWDSVGEAELEDIVAAVEHLVSSGAARPDAVFITGASYGGYLTLWSLGKRPDLFAGGFAYIAMADWVEAFNDPHMVPSLRRTWTAFLRGTPQSNPRTFRRRSPITYVGNVRAPVFLCQGENDTRTPVRQAAEYARRLTEAGGDVLVKWFDGGHETTSATEQDVNHRIMRDLAHRAMRGESWADYDVSD